MLFTLLLKANHIEDPFWKLLLRHHQRPPQKLATRMKVPAVAKRHTLVRQVWGERKIDIKEGTGI